MNSDSVSIELKNKWSSIQEELSGIPIEYIDEFMDNILAETAKKAMTEKLELSRSKGRGGWWTNECSTEYLQQLLEGHIKKGDMRDVMNLAAMIYFRQSAGIISK